MKTHFGLGILFCLHLTPVVLIPVAQSAEVPVVSVVSVVSVQGAVTAQREALAVELVPGAVLVGGTTISTGPQARLVLASTRGDQLVVEERSALALGEQGNELKLDGGQISLWSDDRVWVVVAGGTRMRAQGLLRLRSCGEGCVSPTSPPGLYGKANGGEVIVEYAGGRVVMRERLFRVPVGGGKPELLARDNGLLNPPADFEAARVAKTGMATDIKRGLDAFKAGNYDEARTTLSKVRQSAPGEVVLAYYLGLIALDQQRNDEALRLLQQYAKDDPEGAREREVSKLITLLTTSELQREVKQAVAQEKTTVTEPPDPGSIAVQPFANRASAEHAALAKGIAAMVISDLARVPGLKVLERQKVQKLADEIRLGESGLVDQETAVRAGRLLRAEKVVVGSFGVEP